MESTNSKAGGRDKNDHLVRIIPSNIITNRKDKVGEKGFQNKQWHSDKSGCFFPSNLSVEKLKQILANAKVKMEKVSLNLDETFIFYRYEGRPLIQLNLKNGQFYSPASEVEEYGREAGQKQAHIILDILKEQGCTNAISEKTAFQPNARRLLGELETYQNLKG